MQNSSAEDDRTGPSIRTTSVPVSEHPAARLARRLRWFVLLGALAGMGVVLSSPWWMDAAWLLKLAGSKWHLAAVHTPASVTGAALWGARLAVLLPGLAGLAALHTLRQLLGHYIKGLLFDLKAACLLRRLGWWLTSMGALQAVSPTLALLALTSHNPPGQRILMLGISFEDYTLLIVGALILLLASVMVEAVRLAQENQEFI